MAAANALRCSDVRRHLERLESPAGLDTAGIIAPGFRAFCDAREGVAARAHPALPEGAEPTPLRERNYWLAAAALERGDLKTALAEVDRGFELLRNQSNDELRWRLSAIGATAAREAGDTKRSADLARRGRAALEAVKKSWGDTFAAYAQRSDLLNLKKRSGIT
jgi:hypothetical protein